VPVLTAANLVYPAGGSTLVVDPASSNGFPSTSTPVPVLLEDPAGNATATTITLVGSPPTNATLGTLNPSPATGLASPIDIFFNLLGVSRGKTVASEVLGSGNPSVAGQDFTLAQSPVTYFFDRVSVSGSNFTSTVHVSVNGVQWQEVQNFYGQLANAQVFVLREDDQGQTHVTFGDGVHGALLPTGTNNIVATYRYGAGAAAPAADTLTVVLTPTPGLKGVRNPLPPTGGGAPDSPAQLRSLAPQSVLTFNRAVSLDDYAAIALTASGVTQAVASFAFDPLAQRPVVTLWIAGDANAPAAAAAALAGTEMPNQGLSIKAAVALEAKLSLTYVRDPRYADTAVQASLTTALLDPNTGLLGANVIGIAQPIYQSQIAAACLAVPGVTAIQDVSLTTLAGGGLVPWRVNFIRRFILPTTAAVCAGQSYSPGPGNYFSVPNDSQHLFLTGTTAS
jgi:predicted phage baseplate assembly protein